MSNKEIMQQAIANMTDEQKAAAFPPIERKNFVVRKSWLGRNQVITFVNNKNQKVTYNHDEVLKLMLPKLEIMPAWIKRGYWSQSTDAPVIARAVCEIENLESEPAEAPAEPKKEPKRAKKSTKKAVTVEYNEDAPV